MRPGPNPLGRSVMSVIKAIQLRIGNVSSIQVFEEIQERDNWQNNAVELPNISLLGFDPFRVVPVLDVFLDLLRNAVVGLLNVCHILLVRLLNVLRIVGTPHVSVSVVEDECVA